VKKNKHIILVMIAMVITLGAISLYYWYNNTYFVETDDAMVDGAVINVSPQVSGKILDTYVHEEDRVLAGQVLARIDNVGLPPGANQDLTLVKAPRDGMIIKRLQYPGEMASPAQPLYEMVDPFGLYITANVEEGNVNSLRIGQKVDITLDSIPGVKFTGKVSRIGKAALSVFSLLSSSNTSGNFTKVVQRMPVRISVDDYKGYTFDMGTNAEVKIHIK